MNATHAVPITTIPTLPEGIEFDGLSRLAARPSPRPVRAVGAKGLSRIRSVLSRLPSLDDVTEMRNLASAEARKAKLAGQEGRAEYCLAIADEADSILEAASCQGEPPSLV
jgi:hypothetical protein